MVDSSNISEVIVNSFGVVMFTAMIFACTLYIFMKLIRLADSKLHFLELIDKYLKLDRDSVTSYDIIDGEIVGGKYSDLALIGFDDIKGLDDVKAKVREFVNVFANIDMYLSRGIKVPRGLLFYGPPGCGKTSLAKAIAKEANVNFLCRNASDLVGRNGGITNLFRYARKHSPCIIFIDELDIFSSRFFNGMDGMHQLEVTRLLEELDGMQNNDNILVIAATNAKEHIDKALLRSGRLSKKFYIPAPRNEKDIIDIINMYRGNLEFDKDTSIRQVARSLVGLSPADIKEIFNEVGINCINENRNINIMDVEDAKLELIMETVIVNNQNRNNLALEHVAYHEAGHAIIKLLTGRRLAEVSIRQSNNGMKGFTTIQPIFENEGTRVKISNFSSDKILSTYDSYESTKEEIMGLYGGYVAELYYFGEDEKLVSFGSSEDINRATMLASGIAEYNYGKPDVKYDKLFFDTSKMQEELMNDTMSILDECLHETKTLIFNNIPLLKDFAENLIEHTTLISDDIKNIMLKHYSLSEYEDLISGSRRRKFIEGKANENKKQYEETLDKAKSLIENSSNEIDSSDISFLKGKEEVI